MVELDQVELDRCKRVFFANGGEVKKIPPHATIEDLTTLPRDVRDQILWGRYHPKSQERRKFLMTKTQAHTVEAMIADGLSANQVRAYLVMDTASPEKFCRKLYLAGIPYPERFKVKPEPVEKTVSDCPFNVFRQFCEAEVDAFVKVSHGRSVYDVAPKCGLNSNTLYDCIRKVFGGVEKLRAMPDLAEFKRANVRFNVMQNRRAVSV